MPRKHFYTLWLKDPCYEDTRLFNKLPRYVFKKDAFTKAKELSSLPQFSGCKILVRKITLGSDTCIEWEFECYAQN